MSKYTDEKRYFCNHVCFSPEEDQIDFYDEPGTYPPPFIEIIEDNTGIKIKTYRFEIPKIVAYYAKTHPGFTYAGLDRQKKEGERLFKLKLKNLLDF